MKKKLSTIILVMFVCQIKLFAGINYVNYLKEITSAEELFMSDKPNAAIEAYKRIFRRYPKSFVKDWYIAAQIACRVQDTTNLKLFLNTCFNKGMEWSIVVADSNLITLLDKYPPYEESLKKYTMTHGPFFLSGINIPLRYELTAMFLKDQLYHDLQPEKLWDSLFRIVTKENIERIVTFTKKVRVSGRTSYRHIQQYLR